MTAVDHRLTMAGVQARRAITVRWEISPRAIRHAPVPVIAAMNGQAEKIATARLEWRIDEDRASARLVLEINEDDHVIPLAEARGSWLVDEVSQLEHGTFRDELVVSMRGDELVYVRTRLICQVLALSGGVYGAPRLG